MDSIQLSQKTEKLITSILARNAKLLPEMIDPEEALEKYGIDSLMIMNLNREMEGIFGELSRTLFFEYTTINALTGFFVKNHTSKLLEIFHNEKERKVEPSDEMTRSISYENTVIPVQAYQGTRRRFLNTTPKTDNSNNLYSDCDNGCIAIIGISGRYPKADSLEEFWANLKDGLDCVSEVPQERWDIKKFYHPDKNRKDKMYTKWGGFINDVDKFDALFFNVSPREAQNIDPQERLFLETAWHTFEDAGYTRSRINNRKIGVFAGVMFDHYQLFGNEIAEQALIPTSSHASVANRVSYFFNLNGPSIAVDTMCSSSLTAVYLACESLRKGESEMALAGGVNVTINPLKYRILSQQRFASSDGKCRTFGEGGDGYVSGEGVGAVLLKPLEKAIQDGDRVYAVIRSTAINHGGKTNGYSVPNPNAQESLVKEAIKRAGINPESISFIEAHGTGTSLGDPIEITGLSKAFGEWTEKKGFCPIGSVKSNIGHLEAAAGIAGLTKVVLMLQKGMLVPSLHSENLNSNIRFQDTPFYVQHSYEVWKRPISSEAGGAEFPRRAGLSAFGAGGTNVHIILEEYKTVKKQFENANYSRLVILSAKSMDRLSEYAARLEQFFKSNEQAPAVSQAVFRDVAYTLQVGREALEERIAFIAHKPSEVAEILSKIARGNNDLGEVYRGRAENIRKNPELWKKEAPESRQLLEDKNLNEIAKIWVNGGEFDWKLLYQEEEPNITVLPGYPFARERYWINLKDAKKPVLKTLHPLVDSNHSTFERECFKKNLKGEEFFIMDHVVAGKMLLPGVAHLEMARAACQIALEQPVTVVEDMVWLRPVEVQEEGKTVNIQLIPEEGYIQFLLSDTDSGNKIYSRGRIPLTSSGIKDEVNLDIETIRKRCTKKLDKDYIYGVFEDIGFSYGSSFRVTKELWCGEWESIGILELPDSLTDDGEFMFHPSIADGALRTALGIKEQLSKGMTLRVPFSLKKIEIFSRLPGKCIAYAVINPEDREQFGENVTCDVYITHMNGVCAAKLSGFSARPLSLDSLTSETVEKDNKMHYFYPVLKKKTILNKDIFNQDQQVKNIILFENSDDIKNQIKQSFMTRNINVNIVQIRREAEYRKYDNNTYGIRPSEYEDYILLLSELKGRDITPSQMIHMWSMDSNSVPYSGDDIQAAVSEMEMQMEVGLYSIMNLFKAITQIDSQWNTRCIFSYSSGEYEASPQHKAIVGFANSILNINHHFELVLFKSESKDGSSYLAINNILGVLDSKAAHNGLELEIQEDEIYQRVFEPSEAEPLNSQAFKSGGVYFITGGLGGIGMIVSRHLAGKYQAKLVLTGRSKLGKDGLQKIKELEKLGAEVLYTRADVSVYQELTNAVSEAVNRFEKIDGVLHSAGIIDEIPVTQATKKDFENVMKSKVHGTVYLDWATKDKELDFFVVFSSISAVIGDYGIGSYGAANAFQDGYSFVREALGKSGIRKGNTVSINWPLWEGGGMALPESVNEVYSLYAGMRAITPQEGIKALEHCIVAGLPQVIVACGDEEKICRALKIKREKDQAGKKAYAFMDSAASVSGVNAGFLGGELKKEFSNQTDLYIKKIIAEVINLPVEKVSSKTDFDEYGIDSVMIMELISRFEKDFRNLPKTIFFEHKNIESLAGYFVRNHEEALTALLGVGKSDNESLGDYKAVEAETRQKDYTKRFIIKKEVNNGEAPAKSQNSAGGIAIIGVSGRYPMAQDVDAFWENLKAGVDCISEIPAERWDYKQYYTTENGKNGGIYSKWGGFIEDIDKFDPFFFNMSPRESGMIDPQERIFIETVWHAFEDAGYTRKGLRDNKVGVFVGAMYGHYQLFGVEETMKGNTFATASFFSSIANRVSYIMDFTGPSLALDTACSSSLEALRLACQNINDGCCDIAVAGGVNLSLHPSKYIFLCQANFLSTDGRCRSFGEGGDGYVPGEGVGAVILKPLEKAVADGDNIYAVIKGIATNHGGKTNGYSVPNPAAQGELILDALQKAEIDPRTISYIEAHGTGTSLGDPIEVAGLAKAFGENPEDRTPCSIGSVKSNIGHLESAAGIAGLTKLILQFKHKKLVPSLHSKNLNPNIDFNRSVFRVQQQLEDWKQPVLIENGIEREYPRRAGLSAFGAGGTNVHVVLEEYEAQAKSTEKARNGSKLIVLSARSPEKLMEMACNLSIYLESNKDYLKDKLEEIAYTLQVGREAMEERLAFSAAGLDEIILKMDEFSKKGQAAGVVNGCVDENSSMTFAQDSEDIEYLNSIIKKNNIDKLARLWVKGTEFDWKALYNDGIPKKTPLPYYPFDKERCWLRTSDVKVRNIGSLKEASLGALVDVNISTLMEQLYKKSFSDKDGLIAGHSVAGKKVLPGSAYIEMARAAGELAGSSEVKVLKDVFWIKQFSPIGTEDLYISYSPEGNDVLFSISAIEGEKPGEICKGKVCYEDINHENILSELPAIDIEMVKNRCGTKLEGAELTGLFESMGFCYGDSFQVIRQLYCSQNEVLAFIGKKDKSTGKDYIIDPYMLDGAFRVIAGMGISEKGKLPELRIPFSLGRLDIFGEIPEECIVYAEKSKTISSSSNMFFDIWIFTLSGEAILKISEFAVRLLEKSQISAMQQSTGTENYYVPVWENNLCDVQETKAFLQGGTVIVLGNDNCFSEEFKGLIPENVRLVEVNSGSNYKKVEKNKFFINIENQEHYHRLVTEIIEEAPGTLYLAHIFSYESNSEPHGSNQQGYIGDVIDKRLSTGLYSVLLLFKAVNTAGYKNKTRCIFAFPMAAAAIPPEYYSVSGFAASIISVNYKFELKSLCTDDNVSEPAALAKVISDEFTCSKGFNGAVVKYENGQRFIRVLNELNIKENSNDLRGIKIREGGVYIITGGTGGLGSVFAKYISAKYHVRLALIGRSGLDANKEKLITELKDMGAEAIYINADVGDQNDIKNAISHIRKNFGPINGIIHSAGIAEQIPVGKADGATFERMLRSKVHGSVYIDFLTKEDPLDFYIMFSSVSSIMGDFGAGAYAAANAYMDAFAISRDKLYTEGKRNGRCISIDWPLWHDGGIHLDEEAERIYFEYSGMEAITNENGIAVFERIISTGFPQVVYLKGNASKVSKALKIPANDAGLKAYDHEAEAQSGGGEKQAGVSTDIKSTGMYEKVETYLKNILSETINLAPEKINSKVSFERYGIDSVMIIEFNQKLEKDFKNLPKTLLFEYTSLDGLIDYFMKNQVSTLNIMFSDSDMDGKEPVLENKINQGSIVNSKAGIQLAKYKYRLGNMKPAESAENIGNINACQDIAIIGVSGRYPMSESLDEFWENLKAGRNCISEVPGERWNYALHYKPQRGISGKTYSKWGGFIKDVDKFDPMFFNITPIEAEAIDPQERLFLQTSWSALEDAGYTRRRLAAAEFNVGVFVGVMNCNYEWLGAMASAKGEETNAHSSYWSIANRVSYYMNFNGPSMAVDSACSSSLTAIHLACESIRRGECKMALAGGVNLILHPMHYIRYSMMNMITGDNRCKSFGEGADGFVDGEGTGALVLKPLCDAQRDGDAICAVIKGSYINAGGKTNGYTVPSPAAQAAVISKAIGKSGISPRSISYIEAHGTGTSLGDPIEISGLVKAFSSHYDGSKFCAVGSVKSNIGHLESAAGVAGITKVILQMRHKKLVPSLHSDKLNQNISLEDTPFYIQHKFEDWKKPVVVVNGVEETLPRRAGISSFGAGGANAHIVLEEYEYKQEEGRINRDKPSVFVLSAKNERSLKEYAAKLAGYFERHLCNIGKTNGSADRIESFESFSNKLTDRAAEILCVESKEIDMDDVIADYGLDAMGLNLLSKEVLEEYGKTIPQTGINEYMTFREAYKELFGFTGPAVKSAAAAMNSAGLGTHNDIESVAYTLQTGREHMKERLAFLAAEPEEAVKILKAYSEKNVSGGHGIFTGKASTQEEGCENSHINHTKDLIEAGDYEALAREWTSGGEIDWSLLHTGKNLKIVSLPTYPFEKERYWIPDSEYPVRSGEDSIEPEKERNSLVEILEMLEKGKIDLEEADKMTEVIFSE